MAQENIRALMDRLEQQARARRASEGTSGSPVAPLAPDPGLHYQPGARVRELTSGKRGLVVAGVRSIEGTHQVYEIALETGDTVFRTLAELSRDTLPRSPQNR